MRRDVKGCASFEGAIQAQQAGEKGSADYQIRTGGLSFTKGAPLPLGQAGRATIGYGILLLFSLAQLTSKVSSVPTEAPSCEERVLCATTTAHERGGSRSIPRTRDAEGQFDVLPVSSEEFLRRLIVGSRSWWPGGRWRRLPHRFLCALHSCCYAFSSSASAGSLLNELAQLQSDRHPDPRVWLPESLGKPLKRRLAATASDWSTAFMKKDRLWNARAPMQLVKRRRRQQTDNRVAHVLLCKKPPPLILLHMLIYNNDTNA